MSRIVETVSFVCFRWKPVAGYRSTFGPETVNTLQRMIRRNYTKPHRFICVTDDAAGIDRDVEIVPLWDDFAQVPSPHGGKNPSCYRRLRAFRPEMADVLGPRFVALDLDCVLVADVTPIWDRPEEFVIWGDTHPTTFYNGSMMLMTAGARRQVWDRFDPSTSPQAAKAAGCFGSDQGWISFCLGNGEARWSQADGVYSYRNHLRHTAPSAPRRGTLPADARIVMFHGAHDPWGEEAQGLPWVKRNWC